jgi:hypothetical protein
LIRYGAAKLERPDRLGEPFELATINFREGDTAIRTPPVERHTDDRYDTRIHDTAKHGMVRHHNDRRIWATLAAGMKRGFDSRRLH